MGKKKTIKRGKNKEYLLYFLLIILGLILFSLVLPKFLNVAPLSFSNNLFTGKAVAEDYNFNLGDSLNGRVIINLDEEIKGDKQVLLLIENEGNVVYTEIVFLEEFLKGSEIITKDYIYTKENTYFVELGEVVHFTFEKAGEYELMISILELDLNIVKKFSVN